MIVFKSGNESAVYL